MHLFKPKCFCQLYCIVVNLKQLIVEIGHIQMRTQFMRKHIVDLLVSTILTLPTFLWHPMKQCGPRSSDQGLNCLYIGMSIK